MRARLIALLLALAAFVAAHPGECAETPPRRVRMAFTSLSSVMCPPWIARDAGIRLGFWATMATASAGWLGVRAMTWFLFGQYGTAPLLAFIARRPLVQPEAVALSVAIPAASGSWWRRAIDDFKAELEWLHARGDQFLEYLALPVLQLLAAGLNFGMMMIASRPVFELPFHNMKEVTDTREILATFHMLARKQSV